jgi:hypothetical protein
MYADETRIYTDETRIYAGQPVNLSASKGPLSDTVSDEGLFFCGWKLLKVEMVEVVEG